MQGFQFQQRYRGVKIDTNTVLNSINGLSASDSVFTNAFDLITSRVFRDERKLKLYR